MKSETIKLNINYENKTFYVDLNYNLELLNNKADFDNFPKNSSTDFNINLFESKAMPFLFTVMKGKKNINKLPVFNIKEFYGIEKSLSFRDLNVHNYSFDNIRDFLFINQLKEFLMDYKDIEFKLKKYIKRIIYNYIYFNSKLNKELLLLKMNKLENFNIQEKYDKNEIINLIKNKIYKKDDDTKDETNNDEKNFILDKNLLKDFPPKVPSLYDKKYIFGKDKIPNVFYNHLITTYDVIINKKRIIKSSLTRRIKGKSLTILFYSPVSHLYK